MEKLKKYLETKEMKILAKQKNYKNELFLYTKKGNTTS